MAHPLKTGKEFVKGIITEVKDFADSPPDYVCKKIDSAVETATAIINTSPEERAYLFGTLSEKTLAAIVSAKAAGKVVSKLPGASKSAKAGQTVESGISKGGSGRTFKSQYDIPTRKDGYTKSNLDLGKKVHKEYKSSDVDNITKFKEYTLPSGKKNRLYRF